MNLNNQLINQNFSFPQIGSLDFHENPPPSVYEQNSSFEYLNTSSFIADIRNDCFDNPPESPNNIFLEDMNPLSHLPDDSLTLRRLPISNSSISTTSTVSIYPHYDLSAIPPSIIESPIKPPPLLSSNSKFESSRTTTPIQHYNSLNSSSILVDNFEWSTMSDLRCLIISIISAANSCLIK